MSSLSVALCELSLRCCSSFSSSLETRSKAASDSDDQAEQPARKHQRSDEDVDAASGGEQRHARKQ